MTLTDKEMLEFAALAAGIEIRGWNNDRGGFYAPKSGDDGYWNPLTDDGDAFRLAVELQLITGHDVEDKLTYAQIRFPHFIATEFYGGANIKPCEAMRRSIVRCAAEIGKRL